MISQSVDTASFINEAARSNMVSSQLLPNRITDRRILDVMGSLPREIFVPHNMADVAYLDDDIKIVPGRHIMNPMVLARMMQEAEITALDRVLDIGPATGYSTAVLAQLAKEVVALEVNPGLADMARLNLAALKISNVQVHSGSMLLGMEDSSPYDVIFINGSVEVVPQVILDQLAEGGRLITVFGFQAGYTRVGEARLYKKTCGNTSFISLFNANIRPLPDFVPEPGFVL